ncbi:MAG TPA: peptide ABC transporter substrate-binding protein, partial [Ruminococcaceae bacterium]|nr:peptide ABC transporter substrate-binding protein [Oscillospiraceae bacterium]
MVNEMLAVWNQKTGSYFSMEPLAPDELAKRVTEGRYQIALYGISPGQDGALLSLFLSDNNKNPAHLKSDEFDGLIQKAEQSGEKEAAANYAKAERYLNDKCVFYPVYYKNSYFACAKGVTGIV